MPDLRQALKDFVATSNSGKYADEATLLSKFPELKGYDVNVLKDFVATSNSGKYATEDELFAKFPEFSLGAPSKKKVDTASALAVGSSVSQKSAEVPEEEDYFTGAFGNVLRGLDNIVPIGIGDFVDDMARSVASGYRQAKSAEEADKLLLQGTKPTMDQVQKFIAANKGAKAIGPSAEMQNYQKIYENEGKGFWGVVKGLANNPSIIPEVLTSSLTAMATNTDALTAGAAAVGTGTAYGAGTGALAGGVGAVPGAAAGAIASVPYAFGLASSVVEMGSTFGELLTEELKGKEMSKENVKAILEDPKKLNDIRNKAIARGAIIGTVDALTGKLASGVGAKIVSKSAAKSATGAVTKGAVTRAAAAGAAIESLGGSAGEAAARGAIGQDMDVSEIALEGLAELPGGIRSTIQARLAKPSYKVNGAKATAEQVDEIINTMSPADLAKTKIEIKNDYEGREFKIQDKIVTSAIREQVKQGNPELNEPSLNAITELEKELKKLEGNTTQTGKDKAAAIRGQIKNIQENQIQEEAVVETAQAETAAATTLTPEQRTARIAELDALTAPGGQLSVTSPEWMTAVEELQKLKKEQDAIQEQTTDEGVLRIEQPEMGLQQMGEGNVQPEVVATGTEETITPEGTQEVTTAETQEVFNKEGRYTTNTDENNFAFYHKLENDNTEIDNNSIAEFPETKVPFRLYRTDDYNQAKSQLADGNRPNGSKGIYFSLNKEYSNMYGKSGAKEYYLDLKNPKVITTDFSEFDYQNLSDEDVNNLKEQGYDGVVVHTPKTTVKIEGDDLSGEQELYSEVIAFDKNQVKEVSSKTPKVSVEEITQQINTLEKEKVSLTSKALKQMPNSPIQLETRARINEIDNQISTLKTKQNEQVQSKRTGDGGGRTESRKITPLKGSPSVKGINGPDPQLVAVAEKYAADNGIDLKRQSEYVEVDEDRAKRIADAYEQMKHDPKNPKVKKAYKELIKQTVAQYKALVDAGYKFWFMDLNIPSNVEYAESPYNALRDMRENKQMGVFPTTDGFGTSDLDVEDNPLLAETGFEWSVGGLDGPKKPVLANDLFRAVHDAFGHGLEGAGFRARGEENAWQAHVRLFTGPAIGAITSETRGQNSWLNYGPNGETNKTAKVEDTIFADQKTGLMPEWTWTEGRAGDMEAEVTEQPVVEEVVVEEEEQFQPLKPSDVKTDAFTRDNALFYEEDERESDSGRISTYLSSITVEATNPDGDSIGTITKITDEDKIFYFTAEDADGGEINLDGFETLGDAKKAIADSWNKIQKKEFEKEAKRKAKEKAKKEAKKAKAKVAAEPTVETVTEEVSGAIDDLLALDPNEKTTLEKVSNGLDKVLKDITKFEKENLGVNIALPVIKTIIQAVKALVDAGVALQDAIKRVAKDNNLNSRDVINGINAVSQIAPIQQEYDALMSKADELIARQKKRGIAESKIVSNLDTFIRNSEVYKNANDAQKKIMEREARTKMGAAPKKAVSIGRVLGSLKDITNISREEKMLVIKRIRELSRDAAKDLAKEIREMASGGKITAVQAANIVARFGKVNMLNEISVSNFVDYMAKVFANAEYADKIDVAKSKLKMARKNIVTKIGIADGLVGPLSRLFSMNPTLIPNEYLGRYLELVDMFGARQAVLTLDEKSVVTKDVKAILDEIDNEQSKADELADRFNASENKVFKDDELDYAASVKKMLDEKEIDEKEAETMRKYKEDIAPQVEETELTEAELAAERKELTDAVKNSTVDGSGLPSKDERDTVKELRRLIGTDAVDGLTNTELKNLLKVIDNINNNYLPHYAEIMLEKLEALNTDKVLTKAVEQSKMYKFSQLYSKVKAAVAMQGRTGVLEMIRRNPLFYIDQLFGNFKTKDIFNSLFNEPAKAVASFKTQLNRVQNILEKAEEKVAKSFKLDPNKTTMSKFKMMTYMIQLEFESNKGNKEVNAASNYLKATIKHIDAGKSRFGERDADMLQQILNEYSDADGNIDNEKLYNSFNQAEKDAIKDIRGINESLREKAEFTAAIIRGDRIDPLNNYVHLNVLHEHQPNDLTSGSAFITEYNNSMRPSTKAKSLIARTGKVSPLNFDVFASAQRGAKFVLMDYNLTRPIRVARKTINGTIANLEGKGRVPKEKRQIINAINAAFEESVEGLLTNAFTQDSFFDMASDYISRQGYRAVLAGTSRFISELSSNIGFAVISDPKALATGVKYRGVIMSSDAPTIMENLKSKQTNRIFPTDTLSGRLVDTSILGQASGIRGAVSKNPVKNKIQQIYNLTGKKYVNAVELQADALISTPDKVTMRPMWFGAFANQFENITGKEVDFDKIAANDEAYMEENKEALDKATQLADERSVMVGATDNPFMGILKGTIKPDQSLALKAFNNMNNFMTKFLIFEYVTARTAIMAAVGNGSLTKQQGSAVLGAVATRMVVYGLVLQMMGTGLMGLFYDDEEPETEKSFMQKLGQAFASAFSSLLIGRDFGNAVKNLLNYGVEEANEKYLDFLREGEYDPYKDGIAYTLIPRDESRQTDLGKLLMNMGGSYTPALNTASLIFKKATEKPKVKEEAIARSDKELKVRIPLEVLGNAGLVPLYKDIRKAVMKDLYKDLEKAEKTKGDKKKAEAEKLQGFQNQEDMKRYDYDLWYRTFGPEAPDFDIREAEKLIKREKDSLNREMKDEMYDYTPKPKKGKGGLQKLY